MRRRNILRAAVIGAGSAALSFTLPRHVLAYPALPGTSPYGALQAADSHGLQLPVGFTSRVVARSGQAVIGTSHIWHAAPDGGAGFPDGTGWIYVSNAELAGGAGAIKFDPSGQILAAYPILSGTNRNCAGGATPWGTWLSCEEVDRGYVYETHPHGTTAATRRDAMGRFNHEAAAADPDRQIIYLTEDEPDGCFYRFAPATWGDLSTGTLQVLVDSAGTLSWANIPDSAATTTRTRYQVPNAKRFSGGEGAYYTSGTCLFTTKGDNRVWAYDAARNTLAVAYDDNVTGAPLTGVDNITGSAVGDLYVAEDGGNMEICIITPDDVVAPFLRVTGQNASELTGVAFNPAGNRLYFSSQRGTTGSSSGGITYEVTGPFRTSTGGISGIHTLTTAGKALDNPASSAADGTQMIIWALHGGANQKWALNPHPDGTLTVINQASGKCLDVEANSTAAGARVIQWPYHGGRNQKWWLKPIGARTYIVISASSGLAATAAAATDGALITQETDVGKTLQQWTLSKV